MKSGEARTLATMLSIRNAQPNPAEKAIRGTGQGRLSFTVVLRAMALTLLSCRLVTLAS